VYPSAKSRYNDVQEWTTEIATVTLKKKKKNAAQFVEKENEKRDEKKDITPTCTNVEDRKVASVLPQPPTASYDQDEPTQTLLFLLPIKGRRQLPPPTPRATPHTYSSEEDPFGLSARTGAALREPDLDRLVHAARRHHAYQLVVRAVRGAVGAFPCSSTTSALATPGETGDKV
jgi:hypothetical protein